MVISQSKSIQKKLLAATAMLLVACIMLISASYAWFTLSTAPEITGITTTIGANGNLEIALADPSTWGNPDGIKTNVGDSTNTTWGNIIDLSQGYGLENISLYPSRLNITGSSISAAPLSVPKYGADGRPADFLLAQYAYYSAQNGYLISEDYHGVRIIGTSSSMTDRQLAYRSAKIALANAISEAKAAAKSSLETNGTDLANVIMKKAVDTGDTVTFTSADLDVIDNVLTGVTTAQAKMLKAWEAAVISYAASHTGEAQGSGVDTEEKYLTFKNGMETSYTVDATGKAVTAGAITVVLPDDFITYYGDLGTLATKINQAKEASATLRSTNTEGITWAELRGVLNYIINPDNVTINGHSTGTVKDHLNDLLSDVLDQKGIQVEMPTGSGVYADIADFCGDYSATVLLQGITYNDITLGTAEKPIRATMTTKTTVTTPYFTSASNTVTNAGAPSGQGANSSKLSDYYGYTVDFYMRTNAANANLLLQTDETQRIYGDSTNEETLGGGSNMTFTSSSVEFSTDKMKELMSAIRVVFTDGDGKILAVAVLDTNVNAVNDSIVKADLKLCAYTLETVDNKTMLKITDDETKEGTQPKFLTEQTITALTQNQAVRVSATVYLDGDYVTNAMVANATQSMTGKLNLQFATDAKLVPMDDAALKGTTTGGTTN